tara:strand:- start:736 stop:1740 length:1005 start_codon:yes stop_codon:yes gene_type:complete
MSGGGPKETTQVVKNETIPEWLQPYVTDVASRAQAVSREEYQPYKGQRVAGFDPMQEKAFKQIGQLKRPDQFGQAGGLYNQIAGSAGQLDVSGKVDTGTTQAGTFGEAQAKQYMSPYQQAVTDIAIRKAQEESQRQAGISQLGAAGRGSAGGSRQAVMDAMRMRGLTDTVGDLQARGSQDAFRMAQQQFERDRQARMTAEERDRVAMMTQAERDRAAMMTQAERDRQAQLASARGLTGLGLTQQQSDLQRLAAQQRAGAQQQQRQQKIFDTRYADFLRQRDFPREQLGWYSNIVRGLPAGLESSEITYGRTPSGGAEMLAAGLGGLGAYNQFRS